MAKPNILSKRAYTYAAAFFIIILLAGLIMSCGNDNVVNNGNNTNETLLLSLDTFIVQDSVNTIRDTMLNSTVASSQVRIDFRAETNCTNGDNVSLKFKYKDWVNLTMSDTLNRSFSYNLTRDSSIATNIDLSLLKFSIGYKYVRFVNFNVYKLN